MIFNAETRQVEDANPATLDLFGYSKAQFLKLTAKDIYTESTNTTVAAENFINIKAQDSRFYLYYFKKKDGSIFPGEISASMFSAAWQTKIIAIVRDITPRIKAEEDRQNNADRQKKPGRKQAKIRIDDRVPHKSRWNRSYDFLGPWNQEPIKDMCGQIIYDKRSAKGTNPVVR